MTTPSKQLALQPQALSVPLMLQTMIEKGVTAENVAALSQLCDLHQKMEAKQAEKEFASAFVALQQDIANAKIEATKGVPGKGAIIKFRFAPYEEIMAKVQPLLMNHGFSVTFDQKIEETRIVSVCTLMHIGGHSRSNSFAVRIGDGPPGASASQADGAASTYAKRFALCNALNIVIEQEATDSDAKIVGQPMPEVQWKELEKRASNPKLCISIEKFLSHAHSANFESLPAERFKDLSDLLYRKEMEKGVRNEQGDFIF